MNFIINPFWKAGLQVDTSGGGGGGSVGTLQQVSDAGGLTNGSTLKAGSRNNGFGGGISQVCAIDKELQWEGGVLYYFPVGGSIVYAASVNDVVPDIFYDDSRGWAIGSRFTNLVTGNTYSCTDATTDAAIWELVLSGSKSQVKFVEQIGNVAALSVPNTNYYYSFSDSGELTLPTAVNNTCTYQVKNASNVNITVVFTAGQNADGTTSIIIVPFQSLTFISNNTNYDIN